MSYGTLSAAGLIYNVCSPWEIHLEMAQKIATKLAGASIPNFQTLQLEVTAEKGGRMLTEDD